MVLPMQILQGINVCKEVRGFKNEILQPFFTKPK